MDYRNLRKSKFYTSVMVGGEGYNPTITIYYGSDDNEVRIEEVWRGETWAQTISGTGYAQQWPNYSYTETFNSWEKI